MWELEDPTEGRRWWGVTQEGVWGEDDSPKGLVRPSVIQGRLLDEFLIGSFLGHSTDARGVG